MTIHIVDTETTGLDERAEVIEVGIRSIEESGEIQDDSFLIKTKTELPEFIVNLTGITNDLLNKEGEEKQHVAWKLENRIGKEDIVIAYNAKFDERMIRQNNLIPWHYLHSFYCAMIYSQSQWCMRDRKFFKDPMPVNFKLGTMAKHFDVPAPNAHRALQDVITTYEVLLKINPDIFKSKDSVRLAIPKTTKEFARYIEKWRFGKYI